MDKYDKPPSSIPDIAKNKEHEEKTIGRKTNNKNTKPKTNKCNREALHELADVLHKFKKSR